METFDTSSYEWGRVKRASVGTSTTDCLSSVVSSLVGAGFFVWSLVLYNTASGFTTVGCPMTVLSTLILINGIIDLAFPLMNLMGKTLKLCEVGYRDQGQPGPLNMLFEGIRGISFGASLTSLCVLFIVLFGGASSYCPIVSRSDYDKMRTYAIVNLIVNGLGMVFSAFMACVGVTAGFWNAGGYYEPMPKARLDTQEGLYQSAQA